MNIYSSNFLLNFYVGYTVTSSGTHDFLISIRLSTPNISPYSVQFHKRYCLGPKTKGAQNKS